jgi:hypothetical protein
LHEGLLGEKIIFQPSLKVLLELLIENPSSANYKIIQCEVPLMILSGERPDPSLKKLLITNDKEDQNPCEFW